MIKGVTSSIGGAGGSARSGRSFGGTRASTGSRVATMARGPEGGRSFGIQNPTFSNRGLARFNQSVGYESYKPTHLAVGTRNSAIGSRPTTTMEGKASFNNIVSKNISTNSLQAFHLRNTEAAKPAVAHSFGSTHRAEMKVKIGYNFPRNTLANRVVPLGQKEQRGVSPALSFKKYGEHSQKKYAQQFSRAHRSDMQGIIGNARIENKAIARENIKPSSLHEYNILSDTRSFLNTLDAKSNRSTSRLRSGRIPRVETPRYPMATASASRSERARISPFGSTAQESYRKTSTQLLEQKRHVFPEQSNQVRQFRQKESTLRRTSPEEWQVKAQVRHQARKNHGISSPKEQVFKAKKLEHAITHNQKLRNEQQTRLSQIAAEKAVKNWQTSQITHLDAKQIQRLAQKLESKNALRPDKQANAVAKEVFSKSKVQKSFQPEQTATSAQTLSFAKTYLKTIGNDANTAQTSTARAETSSGTQKQGSWNVHVSSQPTIEQQAQQLVQAQQLLFTDGEHLVNTFKAVGYSPEQAQARVFKALRQRLAKEQAAPSAKENKEIATAPKTLAEVRAQIKKFQQAKTATSPETKTTTLPKSSATANALQSIKLAVVAEPEVQSLNKVRIELQELQKTATDSKAAITTPNGKTVTLSAAVQPQLQALTIIQRAVQEYQQTEPQVDSTQDTQKLEELEKYVATQTEKAPEIGEVVEQELEKLEQTQDPPISDAEKQQDEFQVDVQTNKVRAIGTTLGGKTIFESKQQAGQNVEVTGKEIMDNAPFDATTEATKSQVLRMIKGIPDGSLKDYDDAMRRKVFKSLKEVESAAEALTREFTAVQKGSPNNVSKAAVHRVFSGRAMQKQLQQVA